MAREPDKVAASIKVKGEALRRDRVKSEGKSIITTRRERKRDLAMVVGMEAGGGAGGGEFEKVVGGGEVVMGEGVSEREKKNLGDCKGDM